MAEHGTVADVIGYIEGKAVSEKVVLAAGQGVGYVVARPKPYTAGEQVKLWVTTIVREDAITLYGFDTPEEQACFAALVKVSGVGANTALAVLRDVGVAAVVAKDAAGLARTQGVGPKLAARIAEQVELPDSLRSTGADVAAPAVSELVTVLTALGFAELKAATVAREVVERTPDGGEELWIAAALAELRGAA